MNRGRRSEKIFSDAQDYLMFTELLKETSDMWHVRNAAYCLMPNHYHLLVQTPETNISRSMRYLNGVYTQRYNRWIKEAYGSQKIDNEMPSSRELLPDKNRIFEVVCEFYDVTPPDLLKMRRGKAIEARNVAIYPSRKLRRDTLKEIGRHCQIDNDSTVSRVIERMKKKLAGDRKVRLRLDKLAKSIKKSQEWICPLC
jgi:REP element-mobilizing transposase RayT